MNLIRTRFASPTSVINHDDTTDPEEHVLTRTETVRVFTRTKTHTAPIKVATLERDLYRRAFRDCN